MEERIRRLEAAVLGEQQYEALESFQPKKRSYWSTLAFFNKETYTTDSMWKMFVRPFGLIPLPPVFWATTIMAVTVGFSVAISSAFATEYARVYHFTPFQSGLGFFSSLIGGLVAIPLGGRIGEAIANYFTVRNRGIREPEFRPPAMILSAIAAPLGLILYSAGLQCNWHFIIPITGIGMLTFSIGQGINISFVCILDADPHVRGEVTIAQLAFKSMIDSGLSAGTNIWIAESRELAALSEMAAITIVAFGMGFPLFYYGARLRNWQSGGAIMRWVGGS